MFSSKQSPALAPEERYRPAAAAERTSAEQWDPQNRNSEVICCLGIGLLLSSLLDRENILLVFSLYIGHPFWDD
ncbi:hypothetical protein MC885_000543, partial [Smutsia gigantea]